MILLPPYAEQVVSLVIVTLQLSRLLPVIGQVMFVITFCLVLMP